MPDGVIEFRLEAVDEPLRLERRWLDLQRQVRPDFFLTWTWIAAWLETSAARPALVVGTEEGREMALGLIGSTAAGVDTIALNETGDPALDVGYIEYNGLLSSRDAATLAGPFLDFLGAARAAGPLRGWRALQLSGVPAIWDERCRAAGLWVQHRNVQTSYIVDLAALRDAGKDALSALNANTRRQIRRAMRLYGEAGALALRREAPGAAADAALDELMHLHQARWTADGKPGAFAAPKFEPFVRALMTHGLADGDVEILRVTSGARTIGLLLNLVSSGRVLNYLSGLVQEGDNRLKPGLVTHLLAIEHHRVAGAASYDLLGGEARYKASLAKPHRSMVWLTARPPTAANAVSELARFGRRAAGRLIRTVSGSR